MTTNGANFHNFPDARFFVLIPCAGRGSRAGALGAKQYQPIAGKAMVRHTLDAFAQVPRLDRVLVVVAPHDDFFAQQSCDGFEVAPCGGASRADSVRAGLSVLVQQGARPQDWVLVHDAARCLVTPAQVTQLMQACEHDEVGGLLALPLPDTLKSEAGGRVATTLERTGKWLAQTPQMFRIGMLQQALAAAGSAVTDESSAIEALGQAPRLLAGSAQNFKVTYPEDFALAEAVLRSRQAARPAFRMGEGWDTHALVPGRKLILGGIDVPHSLGLLGHSDADVLLHAITDALLGAAGLGDIGTHFPDTDARFKGADSVVLLQETARLLAAAGLRIGNIDSTVIAQAPRLAPHIPAMRARIAQALDLSPSQVNVKAKTAEKMGPVGEGLSMEARAVALLY